MANSYENLDHQRLRSIIPGVNLAYDKASSDLVARDSESDEVTNAASTSRH